MVGYRAEVNGIEVEARYREETVEEVFLPFLRSLGEKRRRKGSRLLVFLAAPPGAGKTTLAGFLERLSREREGLTPVQAVGMDGFHRRQAYLLSHTVLRDGREIPMTEIKGAPVTFDRERLEAFVKRIAAGEKCGWPVYDRMKHDPAEDAVTVEGEIVLLEGNYLLLEEDGWKDLARYADTTVFVRAEEGLLRERLVERRIRTGKDREASERFVDFSDMPNVRLCLERSAPADLTLEAGADGDYRVIPSRSGSGDLR